jgi:16S rRNA (cytosine967-C5)-methyltransferase
VKSLNSKSVQRFKKPAVDRPRLIAFEIFREVIRNEGYSNLLLNQRLAKSSLDPRDRAFITELLYGSLRQIGRNDFIASKYSNKPWQELDTGIVDIIRMGAYQLFDMRIPTHAAVSTTVDLARTVIGESKASYVNALMRRISEKSLQEHLSDVDANSVAGLSVLYSHPEWIINSYRDQLSSIQEVEQLLQCNNEATTPTLVAWPGKSTQEELLNLGCQPTNYSKFGGTLEKSFGALSDIAAIRERRIGVQDEGSQLVAQIFASAAKAHEPWLDLCAGPGGKAALLSHLATQQFYANEISEHRAKLVDQVVSKSSKVFVGDGRKIAESLSEQLGTINAIIADIPCTGLGALRRRPEVRWRRKPSDLPSLTKLQYELVESAVAVLPTGGILAYATCSPHLAETQLQCATFLKRLPLEQIDISPYLPSGLDDALKNGYMQLWPHRHQTDAMFLALFRKR